jgi:signal transduction histidine kinase
MHCSDAGRTPGSRMMSGQMAHDTPVSDRYERRRPAVVPGLFHASRVHAERPIAAARVLLAVSSLFAIWLDPAEPQRYVTATYALLATYVAYALAILPFAWRRPTARYFGLTTHLTDIVVFSLLQVVTLGPSSPFFVYFVFSVCCGALRWDWRGTLATACIVFLSYLVMGAWMAQALGPTTFELNRFIIRAVYLAVVSSLLLFLGHHEIRLRAEIERLARWPAVGEGDPAIVSDRILAHAATIVGARRALAVWDGSDEASVYLASWNSATSRLLKLAADEITPVVPHGLQSAAFWCPDPATHTIVRVADGRAVSEEWAAPIHRVLLAHIGPSGVVSAPFETARLAGRVFFADIETPAPEMVPLTEVVAREIGTTIDHVYAARQQRSIAASEERIRVARDLHDGVLQSLTGVRLELQAMAASAASEPTEKMHDRLLAIERALAIEQRELRFFIEDLKPATMAVGRQSLEETLTRVRERIATEWKVPVLVRVAPQTSVPYDLEQPIALMVHEAVVNALKHAAPSRVSVDVHTDNGAIRIIVADDGRGFTFQGRYDHRMLSSMNVCPQSLRERIESLGGDLTIESGRTGSRVEISVPLMAVARM